MNNYNYDDEIREERLAREIGRKFAELGFGTFRQMKNMRSQRKISRKKKNETCFLFLFSVD